jgi:hypothetical protein
MGEAWMRSQAWTVSGADGMVIHEKGKAPERSAADVRVSAHYGDLKFKVWVSPEVLRDNITAWAKMLSNLSIPAAERRSESKQYVLDHLAKQRQSNGDKTAIAMAALAWLIADSPMGDFITKPDSPCRHFHYEITDAPDRDEGRRRGFNFRLILGDAREIDDAFIRELTATCPPPTRPND